MDLLDRELCSKATAKSKIEFEKGKVKGSSNKVRTLIRGPQQLDKKYEYNKTRRKTTCWNCIAACLGSMLVNAFSRASSRRVCIASRPAQCIILSRNQSKKDSLL